MLMYATDRIACSQAAGKALYKSKSFTVINNAIDYEKFRFNQLCREKIRRQLRIEDDKVVLGFVGRFVPQKNIFFLFISRLSPFLSFVKKAF